MSSAARNEPGPPNQFGMLDRLWAKTPGCRQDTPLAIAARDQPGSRSARHGPVARLARFSEEGRAWVCDLAGSCALHACSHGARSALLARDRRTSVGSATGQAGGRSRYAGTGRSSVRRTTGYLLY